MKKSVTMLGIFVLDLLLLAGCGSVGKAGRLNDIDNTHSAKVCNIDTDTLPYNEESIYQQLFDINNKIEVEIDISDEVLQQLQQDYEAYEKLGSKSPLYREADLKITITTEQDTVTYVIGKVGIRMKGNTKGYSRFVSRWTSCLSKSMLPRWTRAVICINVTGLELVLILRQPVVLV